MTDSIKDPKSNCMTEVASNHHRFLQTEIILTGVPDRKLCGRPRSIIEKDGGGWRYRGKLYALWVNMIHKLAKDHLDLGWKVESLEEENQSLREDVQRLEAQLKKRRTGSVSEVTLRDGTTMHIEEGDS